MITKDDVKYFFEKLGKSWLKRICVFGIVALFSCVFYNGLLVGTPFSLCLGEGTSSVFSLVPCYSARVWALVGLFVTVCCDFINPRWLDMLSYEFLLVEVIFMAIIGGLVLLL